MRRTPSGKPQLGRHKPIGVADTGSEAVDGGEDATEQTDATRGMTRLGALKPVDASHSVGVAAQETPPPGPTSGSREWQPSRPTTAGHTILWRPLRRLPDGETEAEQRQSLPADRPARTVSADGGF